MKLKRIKVPIYDFRITVIEVESPSDSSEVEFQLKRFRLEKSKIDEIKYAINNDWRNGGDTFRNTDSRIICVLIYKCTNQTIRRNIINHEKRHVVDRILEWASIDDIESAAFLDGYISEYMY